MKTNIHFLSYLAQLFLEREKLQAKVVKKTKIHALRSVTLFSPRKSCPLQDKEEKYCRAGQTTDDSMAHTHYMLDT
jgi:hypothetical protein